MVIAFNTLIKTPPLELSTKRVKRYVGVRSAHQNVLVLRFEITHFDSLSCWFFGVKCFYAPICTTSRVSRAVLYTGLFRALGSKATHQ